MSLADKAKRDSAGWDRERDRLARIRSEKSRRGRDIAPIPAVVSPERRATAEASLEYFCRTYFPSTFSLAWSADHRKVIAKIEAAVRAGGQYAVAMPRGSGKTSLVIAGAMWAMLSGAQDFVALICSDEPSAASLLESIKSELENNDRLLEDYPEVCYPIRRLEGIAHRANGQLCEGLRTFIGWTAKEIVLPTIPGSKASAATVRVAGITGRIRGMQFTRPDGGKARPGMVIVDDPSTDESAKSPTQNAERERIIKGAILGLAGPGRKIAAVMPVTVIAPDDLADRFLDRARNPEWQGERTKMLYGAAKPERDDLWEAYAKLRADGLRAGDTAVGTEFYRANREAMDDGLTAAWAVRFNPGELSAIQHAQNLKFADAAAFASEYQNEPLTPSDQERPALTAAQIAEKVNGHSRGVVPAECTRLTAFIDVQQELLYWIVCGFEDDFGGYVIDYGTYPDQRRSHFTLRDARQTLKRVLQAASLEEALRTGLERLAEQILGRDWPKEDGSTVRVGRCPIDANWAQSRDVVYKFCRESVYTSVLIPSHGIGVGATSQPFSEYRAKRGERKGDHWRETLTPDRPIQRRLIIDANHYKSFVHERLAVPLAGKASLSLFGSSPEDHRLLADHLTSENPIKVEAKGRAVIEWKQPPAKPDNHWFDGIVGCHAAASERGAKLKETAVAPREVKRIKLSDLQKAKRHA